MKHQKTRRGFTLIEVLVVVLIIGILAAIALPMYNRAVLRSRFHALMPIVKAMNDSNEAYYLEHGSYASNPQDLPVQGQSSYPTGTELELGSNMDYAYVLASNRDARNNYIMYQKHSANYPGEIHCEALTGDELAESICASFGHPEGIGVTLTNGYTTYIVEGTGAGIAPGADDNTLSCDAATAMGLTCNITTNEQGQQVKQVCQNGFCRTKTYNEDGSYTSVTCQVNSENVCTSLRYSTTYDANGNKLTFRSCSSVDSSGNCTAYSGGFNYTYDANGNKLTERQCNSADSSGNCTAYNANYSYDYTYDANGNKLSERTCKTVDSSGICTEYNASQSYDYTYDANGNMLTQRQCKTVDSNGNCTAYNANYSYDYTYDANGNKLTELTCNKVDSSGNCAAYRGVMHYTYDANGNQLTQRGCGLGQMDSSGNCTAYNVGTCYDYTYDANGNMLTRLRCSSVNSKNGDCTAYSNSIGYTYDANGNQLTYRTCSSVDNKTGKCGTYSGGNNYTYDANGNKLTQRQCSSVDNKTGNCTAYSRAYYYMYDDNGKEIGYQYCSDSNINTATGECTAYNGTSLSTY